MFRRAGTRRYSGARKLTETVAQLGGPNLTTVNALPALSWAWSDNGWLLGETGRDGAQVTHTWTPDGQPAQVRNTTTGAQTDYRYFLNDWTRSVSDTGAGQSAHTTGYRYLGDGVEGIVAPPLPSGDDGMSIQAATDYVFHGDVSIEHHHPGFEGHLTEEEVKEIVAYAYGLRG